MSDSEDDFMSDKFLVEAPVAETTYASRRKRAEATSAAKAKANEVAPLKEREVTRRREGLATSLLDAPDTGRGQGQTKAMDLMKKMGWKVGEGLGRRRSASPERVGGERSDAGESSARADRERSEDEAPRGGLGSRRAEPIRISMWAGRKGLSARSPSPPPLRRDGTLPPERLAELGARADSYRGRWGAEANERETERKEAKARKLLVELDEEAGVKFHPLHARPGNPDALPKPLFALLYPHEPSRSPSPLIEEAPAAPPQPAATSARANIRHNVNAAEKLREQMRRDMLSELGGDEESVKFGVPLSDDTEKPKPADEEADGSDVPVDWPEMVSGTKRVLAMSPAEHLAFLVSQLRHEHLFCFWCAYKYASWEEMDGFGGCPGEDEDDH